MLRVLSIPMIDYLKLEILESRGELLTRLAHLQMFLFAKYS